jgi:hypothetical protein
VKNSKTKIPINIWMDGWDGMGWDGMGWDGMGWDGMDGMDGMGWDGMGWIIRWLDRRLTCWFYFV